MTLIITLSVLMVIVGIIFLIAVIKLSLGSQNKAGNNKILVVIMASTFLLLFLGIINGFFITMHMLEKKDHLTDMLKNTIKITTGIMVEGIKESFEDLNKKWDKEEIKKFEKIKVTIENIAISKTQKTQQITLDLIFNNQNTTDEKINLYDILSGNYLLLVDSNTILYPVKASFQHHVVLPHGKSRVHLELKIRQDALLKYVRYIHENIAIPTEQKLNKK